MYDSSLDEALQIPPRSIFCNDFYIVLLGLPLKTFVTSILEFLNELSKVMLPIYYVWYEHICTNSSNGVLTFKVAYEFSLKTNSSRDRCRTQCPRQLVRLFIPKPTQITQFNLNKMVEKQRNNQHNNW